MYGKSCWKKSKWMGVALMRVSCHSCAIILTFNWQLLHTYIHIHTYTYIHTYMTYMYTWHTSIKAKTIFKKKVGNACRIDFFFLFFDFYFIYIWVLLLTLVCVFFFLFVWVVLLYWLSCWCDVFFFFFSGPIVCICLLWGYIHTWIETCNDCCRCFFKLSEHFFIALVGMTHSTHPAIGVAISIGNKISTMGIYLYCCRG